jgi:hypothetical protein
MKLVESAQWFTGHHSPASACKLFCIGLQPWQDACKQTRSLQAEVPTLVLVLVQGQGQA